MSDTSKKPRETMIVTADMPTDYIATNGYEYVLKSKYQSLKEQCEKLEKALEFIAKDETPELSDSTNYVSALQVARQALAEFKKFKGGL